MKRNPLAMGTPEKVALAMMLTGGAVAAIYYANRPSVVAPVPPATTTPTTTPVTAGTILVKPGQTTPVSAKVGNTILVQLPLSGTTANYLAGNSGPALALSAPSQMSSPTMASFSFIAQEPGTQVITFSGVDSTNAATGVVLSFTIVVS